MRLQTYYLVDIQLDRKNKMSYEKFCGKYMHFGWEPKSRYMIEQEALQNMTPEDWAERDKRYLPKEDAK